MKEPSLEKEFNKIFDTENRGVPVIIRKFRRDGTGNKKRCPHVSHLGQSEDSFCPACFGVSFIFDEILVDSYQTNSVSITRGSYKQKMTPVGLSKDESFIFYIKAKELIQEGDILVTILLEKNGTPKLPIVRLASYNISAAIEFRLDENGSRQYYRLHGVKDNQTFLNPAIGNLVPIRSS